MAAPAIDTTKPDYSNQASSDIDAIRDNIIWIMIAAASNNYMLPGWATAASGSDLSEPDYIEMTKGSVKMRWTFTWSSGNVTQIIWQYDKGLGAGLETLTGGTLAISYDGSSNFSSVASS